VDAPGVLAREPGTANLAFVVALVAAYVVFAVAAFQRPGLTVKSYPVAAVDYIESHGLRAAGHHLAEQDVVGCYLDLRFGRQARSFIDDRFDMFPEAVSNDYEHLLRGDDKSLDVLDRYHVDVVLWDRHLALVTVLRATGQWQEGFTNGAWTLLQRA